MFAARYWPNRYYAPRYFAKIGSDLAVADPVVCSPTQVTVVGTGALQVTLAQNGALLAVAVDNGALQAIATETGVTSVEVFCA